MKEKLKQTEKDIKTVLSYANRIITTLRWPFLVIDKNLRVISVNRSFCTTFKVTKKETIGQLLPNLGNRQWNIPKLIHLLKEILPKKTVVENYEIEHEFKTIGHRIMSLNAYQMRIPKKIAKLIIKEEEEEEQQQQQQEELILLAIEDITERKMAERRVQEAHEYAESIINTIREPLLVLSRELRVVSVSRSFCQIFKVTHKETEGKFIYNIGNRQWDISKLRQLLEKILPDKAEFNNFEVEHKFPKIGKRTMLLNARRIPPPPAQPERILLAIEDITERKMAEAVRIKADALEKELEEQKKVDKIKSEFISIASHQLGTPLTGIQWTIERILKKEELNIGMKGYLQDIHFSAKRLSALVADLLNISRFEEGRITILAKQLDLVAFIKEYIVECTPLFIKKGITLVFEKHPKILNITTDRNILRNIIQSLISNAIEYTSKGGKVKVFLERKDSHFLFTVNDTGIGIPKEEQAAIFKKFSRGSNAQIINREGLGLGLYSASQTVKLLNGKIWLESPAPGAKRDKQSKQGNKGTTFYVELALKYAK